MIGTFNQPSQVIVDTKFLKTLSKLEIQCGLMEVIKHGLISDKRFLVVNCELCGTTSSLSPCTNKIGVLLSLCFPSIILSLLNSIFFLSRAPEFWQSFVFKIDAETKSCGF